MLPKILAICSISSIIIGIGLLLNGFIVITNLFWWMKGQTVQPINVLITGLGLVRIILLSIIAKEVYFTMFGLPLFHVDSHPQYIDTLLVCLMFCNLWWGSVLCVFYCMKITNYSNRIFMRLKMKISKMVHWLLLISLAISVLSSLPCTWVIFAIRVVNGTGSRSMEVNIVHLFITVFAGSIIPFTLFCAAIYLIIVSLLRHTRNMNSRDSGFSHSQREVHLSVIRNMISFILFYVMFFVAYILFCSTLNLKSDTFRLICFIFICAYPSLHSIALIVGNKELKTFFCVVLSCTWLGNSKRQSP
ncbi:taste receptor type 2 member 39-like [Hyla sarda]|uniref:taste receptor type 2 member 39-like n=1 Tax=Hyla sarda TaxID=327740 RepID=UPI0024C2BCC1|nr:taste receptor type 2 member 39-like [Hyla sarda]